MELAEFQPALPREMPSGKGLFCQWCQSYTSTAAFCRSSSPTDLSTVSLSSPGSVVHRSSQSGREGSR